MNAYQIISIIGMPSIITIVGLIYTRERSLRLGVQALLRAQMINDYYKYSEKGYAPLHAKDNFENCYKLREEFLSLPLKPSNRKMAKIKKTR